MGKDSRLAGSKLMMPFDIVKYLLAFVIHLLRHQETLPVLNYSEVYFLHILNTPN
jgi:hypothetical protein